MRAETHTAELHNSANPDPVPFAVSEREEKYRTLFRYIAVGVFRSIPGPKGRFMEVNPALVKMLGYESEEVIGRRVACG